MSAIKSIQVEELIDRSLARPIRPRGNYLSTGPTGENRLTGSVPATMAIARLFSWIVGSAETGTAVLD
jgi:hypothetical protein